MIRENCSKIGVITKTQGISGAVMVRLNGDFADDIEPGEPVFVEVDGNLVPFFIEEAELFPDRAVLKMEFIDTQNEAKKYTGMKVWLETSRIASVAEPNDGGLADLISYTFTDKSTGREGTIKDFIDNPANPLFLALSGKTEFYIPAHPDLIVKADHRKKHLILVLPEGLAEV